MTARSPAFMARRLRCAWALVTPVQAATPSFWRSSHAYSVGSVLSSQYPTRGEVRLAARSRQRGRLAGVSACYMEAGMFGLSFGEIVIIAIVALLLLGPDRLPEAAKTLGKGLREIRKATDDLKDQVEREIYVDDRKVARPALVPPVAAAPVPGPAGPPPAASAENVPGLEAA